MLETGPSILIVDDNELIRILTRRTLSSAGYHVVDVENPFEVPRIAHHIRPALILLDVSMPQISGPKLLKICQNQESFRETTVYYHSARDESELRHLTLTTGAHGYIQKPWKRSLFLQTVKDAIARRFQEPLATSRDTPAPWLQQTQATPSAAFSRHNEGTSLQFTRHDSTTRKMGALLIQLEEAHTRDDAKAAASIASNLRAQREHLCEEDAERLTGFLSMLGY